MTGAPTPGAPPQPYQYAVLRVVPRVERAEFLNVGVVVFSRPLDFLDVRVELDAELLARMAPACDVARVQARLDGIVRVAHGDSGAGPIARLTTSERFHWLVAPSSTVVQVSPAHTGTTTDPVAQLARLFEQLVAR